MMNKAAPTVGGAVGYFIITAWAIPEGYIDEKFIAEAVVFSGIIATNALMEVKNIFIWVASLFTKSKDKDEEK